MPLTKSDLEDMMKKQKQERMTEMTMMKEILMEGVREEIQSQLSDFRKEIDEKVTGIREEVDERISNIEQKQNESSDVQSIMDCKVDKLENDMKTLKEMYMNRIDIHSEVADKVTDNPEDVEKLVKYALKVVGFKPIEQRDIDRIKRIENIDDEEEVKRSCLREFWRCELRMPITAVEELLEDIVKVWNPPEADWDKLYVEFKNERSVKLCFSHCKFMRNKDSKILQFFPAEFREQYRTLDSIAFKLRKPDNSCETKFKTRLRFGKHGLVLEKRHPEQRNWTRVPVHHLPPVDLNPVPLAAASSSPPSERSRESKRARSPQSSPPSRRPSKNTRLDRKKEDHEKQVNFENVEKNFVFQNLVKKYDLC